MIFLIQQFLIKYLFFTFFKGWFISVGEFFQKHFILVVNCFNEYFKDLLSSEGILSSLQFGFTALLTLLVATGISLYDSRKDVEYQIDKTVISKILNLQWLLASVVFASFLIFLFNNDSDKASAAFNSSLALALLFPFGYLVWVNYKVIGCLTNIKKYRQDYLLKNNSGEVLDFWEEYFKRLGEQKDETKENLKQREFYKFKEEGSDYIKLFFKKIDKLDFKKDANFAAEMLQVFLQGFENVDFEIFSRESWILDKILEWHKVAWRNCYLQNTETQFKIDNSYLERVLMDLINKVLEKSLIENRMVFHNLIEKLDTHIEKNGEVKIGRFHYISNQNFDFHNTLLNNLHKSSFLREIKSENSEYYFPQRWIITEPRNPINNYWLEILLDHWLFEKLNWGNLNHNFDEEIKKQVKTVIEVFFREVEYNWFLEAVLYWRMFLPTRGFSPENLTRKDKIKTLLDVKLNYPEFYCWGKTRVYTFRKEEKQADNTIKLILQIYEKESNRYINFNFDLKKNISQDLQEIQTLENDKTLTDTQKSRLQTIKQIWQEIEKELKN